jgi:hypothetical protein
MNRSHVDDPDMLKKMLLEWKRIFIEDIPPKSLLVQLVQLIQLIQTSISFAMRIPSLSEGAIKEIWDQTYERQ